MAQDGKNTWQEEAEAWKKFQEKNLERIHRTLDEIEKLQKASKDPNKPDWLARGLLAVVIILLVVIVWFLKTHPI